MFFTMRYIRFSCIFILFFLLSVYPTARAQSWISNGPYFKNIKAVTQSPTNPNLLYAGAFGWGVFKSTNSGSAWVNFKTGLTNSHARTILALSDSVVYVGTNDGVFKTTNGGVSWVSSLTTLHSVRSIVYDSKSGSLYAATYGSDLYKSINQGGLWTHIIVTDPGTNETMHHLWSLAVFGKDSLYAGGSILDITAGGALFKSVDGGVNWLQVQNPTGIRSSVHSIAISPSDSASSLIIGTAAKGVYKSTNGGVNWSNIDGTTVTHPLADTKVNAVGFNATEFYAGTDSTGNLYYRALADATIGWLTSSGLPGAQVVVNAIKINSPASNIVYVGTEGKGVYKSNDSGFTWQAMNGGMLGTAGRSVKLNGNGNLILGTDFGDGIWLSTNQGGAWIRADTLTTSNSITSVGITNVSSTVYACDYGTGVYKSIDGGHIWHITDSTVINHFARSLVVHPSNASLVYAGTGNGVFKTTNGGTSWFASSTGIPLNTSIRSMEIDLSNPNVIYAGTDSNYMYKTIDAGANWTQISNLNGFLTQDKFIRSITVDHTIPNIVYAGADSGRIYKSINAGSAWSLLFKLPGTHSVRSLLINPNDRKTLFAGTFGDGIFVSNDSGAHWSTFNNGLPDLEVYSLESDNANPLNLYAGSGSSGVFHTTYSFVSRPPRLALIGNKSISPNQLLSFTVSATDSDGTIPILSVVGLPSGAVFTDSLNGKGSFHWMPTSGQTGSHSLTFKASDGILVDTQAVLINVINRPPVLSLIGNKSVSAGHLLSFTISATDSDGTIPILSVVGLPSGAVFTDSLNGKGGFYWMPTNGQTGSHTLTFKASDGILVDTEVVVISVTNSSPVLSLIGNKSVFAGHLLSFTVSATDPDLTVPTLSAHTLPSGASFSDSLNGHGLFKWTPTLLQIGNHSLTFVASDGSLADSQLVVISVLDSATSAIFDMHVDAGWNLISVPLVVHDFTKTVLFPSSSSSAYSYSGSYITRDTLSNGDGFWLKFSSVQTVQVGGSRILKDTLDVKANWNMIGSLSDAIPITKVTPVPPLVLKSNYYRYTAGSGYQIADTLKPGQGYWVKTNQIGKLARSSTSALMSQIVYPKSNSELSQMVSDGLLNSISFGIPSGNQRKIFFSASNKFLNSQDYELPPIPPQGMDVRFGSQSFVTFVDDNKREYPITISSDEYPLMLQWTVNESNVIYALEIKDENKQSQQVNLSGKGNITLNIKGITESKLLVSKNKINQVPRDYMLGQNYPNPFNPSTKLQYALPTSARVSLTIYNIIGQEVAKLVEGVQDAGFHSVEWKAENMTSGVYLYILKVYDTETGKPLYESAQKLILMK